MARGGKREGAGRPVGSKKEPTINYQKRIKPEWKPLIDKFILNLKLAHKDSLQGCRNNE